MILRLADVAFTVVASASFSTPIISSSLNRLLFISFCSFYLSRTTLFNCPLFRDQAIGQVRARVFPVPFSRNPSSMRYFLAYCINTGFRSSCSQHITHVLLGKALVQ